MKKMKDEIDVLKNSIKSLISIKEEGEYIKRDVKIIKEEIKLLLACNKETADKISQLEEYSEYETEEETRPRQSVPNSWS